MKGLRSIGRLALAALLVGGCALVPLTACSQLNVANSYGEKAKTIVVQANMSVVQKAAEKYFRDHSYMYPTQINDEFKYYFPNGDPAAKKVGDPPTNPFTGLGEWPVMGTITNVEKMRMTGPVDMKKGEIQYSAINGGKSYAIVAGGEDNKTITQKGIKMMLVVSRDSYKKE